MARTKIAISLDEHTLRRLDQLVADAVFPSRSQAIQIAIEEKLMRLEQSRLARECAKLDPAFEKALAEEGLSEQPVTGCPVEQPVDPEQVGRIVKGVIDELKQRGIA